MSAAVVPWPGTVAHRTLWSVCLASAGRLGDCARSSREACEVAKGHVRSSVEVLRTCVGLERLEHV